MNKSMVIIIYDEKVKNGGREVRYQWCCAWFYAVVVWW